MWPHIDVEQECAILAKMGYLGVKLFPAQEQIMSYETFSGDLNPWYFAYQPVSYRLQGRMGTRDQLRSAIHSCRKAGVRVYADAVINHMSGGGNDANPKHRNPNAGCATWGIKNSSLVTPGGASGPSPMFTQNYVYSTNDYTTFPASQEYPAAHLGPTGSPHPPSVLLLILLLHRFPLRETSKLLEWSSATQCWLALGLALTLFFILLSDSFSLPLLLSLCL
jgi:alpha-amylase